MNITSTESTFTKFTPIFTTLLQISDGKGGCAAGGEPSAHLENIEWKQTLGVLSLVLLALFIVLSLLQIKIHQNCYPRFRKQQCGNVSGKILFALFIVSLIMFCAN
eukprot:345157_1